MKLIKEINEMRALLPQSEKEIFDTIYNGISDKTHKHRQIFYNLLLWRTKQQRDII
jgi:hypothetical protein